MSQHSHSPLTSVIAMSQSSTTLVVLGDVTIFEVADWKQRLCASLAAGEVRLDLSNAGHIDASGVQLLLAAHCTGKLVLHDVPAAVAEEFERVGWVSFRQGT